MLLDTAALISRLFILTHEGLTPVFKALTSPEPLVTHTPSEDGIRFDLRGSEQFQRCQFSGSIVRFIKINTVGVLNVIVKPLKRHREKAEFQYLFMKIFKVLNLNLILFLF